MRRKRGGETNVFGSRDYAYMKISFDGSLAQRVEWRPHSDPAVLFLARYMYDGNHLKSFESVPYFRTQTLRYGELGEWWVSRFGGRHKQLQLSLPEVVHASEYMLGCAFTILSEFLDVEYRIRIPVQRRRYS